MLTKYAKFYTHLGIEDAPQVGPGHRKIRSRLDGFEVAGLARVSQKRVRNKDGGGGESRKKDVRNI